MGTLFVGLFAQDSVMPKTTGNGLFFGGGFALLKAQLIGSLAVGVFTFAVALVIWSIIKAVMGLRVTQEEEMEGLDFGEHGIVAYPDFQAVTHSIGIPGSVAASEYHQMSPVTVPKRAPAHQ